MQDAEKTIINTFLRGGAKFVAEQERHAEELLKLIQENYLPRLLAQPNNNHYRDVLVDGLIMLNQSLDELAIFYQFYDRPLFASPENQASISRHLKNIIEQQAFVKSCLKTLAPEQLKSKSSLNASLSVREEWLQHMSDLNNVRFTWLSLLTAMHDFAGNLLSNGTNNIVFRNTSLMFGQMVNSMQILNDVLSTTNKLYTITQEQLNALGYS